MIALKKILVPTDFSEHSEKAVLYGTELARKFGADLHLYHVIPPPPVAFTDGGAFPYPSPQEWDENTQKQLEKIDIQLPDDVQVVRKSAHGSPFVQIVRYAKDEEVGLIVLGTHGRGAIAHMLLGSVADKVVRKAPCPVLVVRDQEHDFVMP